MTTSIEGKIESLLFIWGEPLELKEIAKALDLSRKDTLNHIHILMEDYKNRSSGLEIIEVNDTYQMTTNKNYYSFIQEWISEDKKKKLSNSALEVLAMIAYRQPTTRIEIDDLRGVSSSGPIETLKKKGYIEEAGRKETIGRPILYKTTNLFLRDFEMNHISELPGYSDIEMYIKMMEYDNENQ